jgi:hypothetical protein
MMSLPALVSLPYHEAPHGSIRQPRRQARLGSGWLFGIALRRSSRWRPLWSPRERFFASIGELEVFEKRTVLVILAAIALLAFVCFVTLGPWVVAHPAPDWWLAE